MIATRTFLVLLAVSGLATSMWNAQPEDPHAFSGWLFASFSSFAWFLAVLLAAVTKRGRAAVAICAVTVLGVSELLVYLYVRDPLFLVMKPIYQTVLFGVGAAIGAPFLRGHHVEA